MIKLLSPLAKLEELNLGTIFKEKPPCRSGNFFGGTLHYADVAVFTKLKKLDLSNTSLHGIWVVCIFADVFTDVFIRFLQVSCPRYSNLPI
jgi:hypothetical protein